MGKIKVAIVGVGNCASSLVQGIHYYRNARDDEFVPGVMHVNFGGYHISDIEVVAAFDVNTNKVGKDVAEAIYAEPNNTAIFAQVPKLGVTVSRGPRLDGVNKYTAELVPVDDNAKVADVVKVLEDSGAEAVINYLPVGSQQATEFYAEAAIAAGCGFVNCIPVFIASNPVWAKKFEDAGLPVIGDDIKAQVGATITHRTLVNLFLDRGMKIERTYQLNTGGNTDFLNMLERERLHYKKVSKTEAVSSQIEARGQTIEPENIHVGPSDYVPWQKDNKICFLRIESKHFGDVPMNMEVRLSVEDSPNSAGVAIDSIRCLKLALDNKLKGAIIEPAAYFQKHPPKQIEDRTARELVEKFIQKYGHKPATSKKPAKKLAAAK
ncbi:MAG TPA: inositol-3-phosphate synthase [Candidatus Pristimantibacillus sp.]|jgi:myo-inositol-1-phosphate synthase|nr:inositol-3-phosphate synthase [Candidatus Pristimantibacillus sp.]